MLYCSHLAGGWVVGDLTKEDWYDFATYTEAFRLTPNPGDMVIAIIHQWHAGYDGRDIEFIMEGMSFSGVLMQVIDFNQVRPQLNYLQ